MKKQSLDIKDIIRVLPFTHDFQKKLLEIYPDKLSEERRVNLEQYLWKMFYLFFDLQYDYNLQKFIGEVRNNLPADYHDQVLERTRKEIFDGITVKKTSHALEELRTDLQNIVSNT